MKIKYLTLATLFSMTIGMANMAHADGHHAVESLDFSTPLPALESLQDVKEVEFHLPKFERFSTDNGVPVIFTHLDGLPMVDVSVEFRAGSAFDNQIRSDGAGIASMTAELLTKGTTRLDEEAFTLTKDRLGVELGAGASKDSFEISLRSLTDDKTLSDALDLFEEIMTTPAFDSAVLERSKAKLKSSLKQSEQNPSQVASRAFNRALFGTHPYAMPTTGDMTTVDKLTRDDLVNFKNKFLVADNAVITITGNLNREQADDIARRLSHALPKGEKASALPTPSAPTPTHIHLPHDSTQTAIVIGHLAPKFATTEREFANKTRFNLANNVLAGGSFNARLMNEIREKRGYTYGIYGRSTALDASGSYQILFSTAGNQAQSAIKDTLQVVNDTLHDGIRQDELALVSNQQKHRYPMSFASNSAIHGIASTLNLKNLSDDYAAGELSRIEGTNLQNANDALKQTIRPDEFIIITVGKDKPDLSSIFPTK